MSLKLIPFSEKWIDHGKIDVHAIYRRPRFVEDEYGELQRELSPNGLPTWDLTGALPVKQHNRWRAKGFEYVTLADRDSLIMAAQAGTLPPGMTASDFVQNTMTGGPWHYKKYIDGQKETTTLEADQLAADVAEFGSHIVETLRKRTDPNFRLPEGLRNVQPPAPRVVEMPDDKPAAPKKGSKQEVA